MRDKYEMQLRKLHAEMIEMGTMIEQAIETAIKALVAQDTELAKKAIEADDAIDHQEREIENLCLKLFLTQQPVAGDMRNISAALKRIWRGLEITPQIYQNSHCAWLAHHI